ncbi:MAG: pyridoxamine 5'-phosphate oxidase family protein [Actinobacteria bacterium]|nr:pyridoxamine 5'-phosphate oxidase family protein [Actinomycetota bacterium]
MIRPLPDSVRDVLDRGALLHLASRTSRGPHVTPVVHAVHGDRLWVTTARSSVKARAWKRDPVVGGLVRAGTLAVSVTGTVRTHDLLDPGTWGASVLHAPSIGLAAARFTLRNARFFAGYAVDARHVPLAWTPPGRVFAAIDVERVALIDLRVGRVVRTWGVPDPPGDLFPGTPRSFGRRRGWDPLPALPVDVTSRIGRSGRAVLGIEGPGGPVVLPAGWAAGAGDGIVAALPEEVLSLAGLPGSSARAALVVDRASAWRARAMTGVLLVGRGDVVIPTRLERGRAAADRAVAATGQAASGAAVVRIRAERAVWWRGWSSGTVTAP